MRSVFINSVCFLAFISFSCLSVVRLSSQSELSFFSHIGHGDERILLDPEDTRWIKEYRMGLAYNHEIMGFRKTSLLLGAGYDYYKYVGTHQYVERESMGNVLFAFRAKSVKYHNLQVNLVGKRKLNKYLFVSLQASSEFTGMIIPYWTYNRFRFDNFKYFGTSFYAGFGYTFNRSTLTPQLRVFSIKPTDSRIFNARNSYLNEQYAEQVDKNLNLNNAVQFGIQYS